MKAYMICPVSHRDPNLPPIRASFHPLAQAKASGICLHGGGRGKWGQGSGKISGEKPVGAYFGGSSEAKLNALDPVP